MVWVHLLSAQPHKMFPWDEVLPWDFNQGCSTLSDSQRTHPLPVPSTVPAAHPGDLSASLPPHPPGAAIALSKRHPLTPARPSRGTLGAEKDTCQEGNSGCLLLCCRSSFSPGDSSPRPPSCLGCPSPRSSISPIRQMRRQVLGDVRAHHGDIKAGAVTL